MRSGPFFMRSCAGEYFCQEEAIRRGSGLSPLTRAEALETPLPDLPPDEAERGEADCSGHAADLAIATFGDDEFDPLIGDGFSEPDRRIAVPEVGWPDQACLCGSGRTVLKPEAGLKRQEIGLVRRALNLNEIGLFCPSLRAGDTGLKSPVVGENEEAFAVPIEAARRVNIGWQIEAGEGRAFCW